jgi:hypothetical protein
MKRIFTLLLITSVCSLAEAQWINPIHLDDLNNWTSTSGFFEWYAHTNNTPNSTNYGNGIQLLLGHDTRHGAQIAIPTFDQNIYFRRYAGGWSSWDKVWHSGNLNRSDMDFTANRLTAKELAIYSDESSGGWGITHLYWKGHSLILGSPKGSYAHNAIVFRPGGASQGFLDNSLSIDVAHGIDNYETRIYFSGSGNSYINSGNFGIGVTNPQNKLDVNGTIHAREVKVDLTGWSDFVFHPSYQLKPLTEVEQFIKTNGHLQDIPSAAEVEQNGVNVGEMQTKLLQKVEELTLYVIEKDKEISEQKKILEKLEKLNIVQSQLLLEMKKRIDTLETKP